jgi:hypothetical protein
MSSGNPFFKEPKLSILGPKMSWGVLDLVTHEETEFAANGGHFISVRGHSYLVVVRAEDSGGVQKMTLDGSGRFECETNPDLAGQTYPAPEHLPASILRQEFIDNGTSPILHNLIALMPNGLLFDYYSLSCGFHYYGTSGNLEYFAVSGLMTFSAISVNFGGFEATASLTTSTT